MRIIAGRWKGHPLVSFQADHIRPTTDRVKETMFNMIQFYLENARVLDLFCGTGNLGLEALSRGAGHVLFVEKHPKSLQITRDNLQKLKAGRDEYELQSQDVLRFLKTYTGEPFDLIFADPPFTEAMAHEVMEHASASAAFGAETLMMIESARRERIDDEYETLRRVDSREFGDKILSFYRKKDHKGS
ncbi:MAG: 16S rRNA (guanine(966)-N(2))-methyltransferase RsmD [Bdellovibrionaceae bacterium]|nr:16S rRNA (guanine(966)-N(2))-methyltransferase RsmD [Pseudobdellovibrionaceae bacterium]MBX3032845.1 16S rRNA (guanine(966)-N(2))-methyltransferase RsmD [Pseudobdellovibrionaceae bacterium]